MAMAGAKALHKDLFAESRSSKAKSVKGENQVVSHSANLKNNRVSGNKRHFHCFFGWGESMG